MDEECFKLPQALKPHQQELCEYDEEREERLAIQEEGKAPSEDSESPLDFPKEVMSGAAGNFAYAYSQYLEPPISFFVMAYLTTLGNIISNQIALQSEIRPQTRIFNITLGRSADERKSTAIHKTVEFFREALTQGSMNVCYGVGSAEGLAKALEDNSKTLLVCDEAKALVQMC